MSSGSPIDMLNSLLIGFAVASLGISGYESSANFIEVFTLSHFPFKVFSGKAAMSIVLVPSGCRELAVINRCSLLNSFELWIQI